MGSTVAGDFPPTAPRVQVLSLLHHFLVVQTRTFLLLFPIGELHWTIANVSRVFP